MGDEKGSPLWDDVVDLEQHRPIDLLGSREADEVAAWFQAHPALEMVSRDRGKEFIKAATEGAPQAEQVADRWHLLANLREAVGTFLQHKPVCLQAAAQDAETDRPEEALMPTDQPESSPTSEPVESPSPSPQSKQRKRDP